MNTSSLVWRERVELALSTVASVRRRELHPRIRQFALAVSVVVFVALSLVAYRSVSTELGSANWALILTAGGVGAVVSQLVNSLEYREIARLSGEQTPLWQAIRVSFIASTANLLPIPGSVMVRVNSLVKQGATVRKVATISLAVGGYFVSLAMLASGLVVAVARGSLVMAICGIGGLMGVIASAALLVSAGCRSLSGHLRIVLIEMCLIIVGGLRITLILIGLGFDVRPSQGVGLMVAGAMTTAVGFFPAGLGLREGLIAMISPIVGITAAAGLSGAIVERVFRMLMLASCAVVLLITSSNRRRSERLDVEDV